jgi:thiol-disulfide isomerase/thioredoxin
MMLKRQVQNSHWKAIAVAVLIGSASSGCGSDGPTEPKPVSLPDLFGTQLLRADGSTVGVAALSGVPVIGIYFASPGCPACTAFTPTLIDVYNQLEDAGRSFEVVLVTLNVNNSALLAYMVDFGMPWLAVSAQTGKANALAQRYNVQWVPTLVIIDGAGRTISLNGRQEVTQSGVGAYDVWLGAGSGD